MSKVKINTNETILIGEMISAFEPYHNIKGEEYLRAELSIIRQSGEEDILPIIVSERLLEDDMKIGCFVNAEGQIRTYNKEGGSIETYLFARDISLAEEGRYENKVRLNGYLCKKGNYRTTYSGRKIADFILAVNRAYGKSDYVPVLAWGKNAKYVEKQAIPVQFEIEGRFQSRTYCKRDSEGKKIERIAYEISTSSINVVE